MLEKKYLLLVFSLLFLVQFSSSCKKECPDGFSGEDCENRESDKFLGLYEGTVNCGYTDAYTTLEIKRNIGAFKVDLYLTNPSEFVLKAHVNKDSLFIEEQFVIFDDDIAPDTIDCKESFGILRSDSLEIPLFIVTRDVIPLESTCQFKLIK